MELIFLINDFCLRFLHNTSGFLGFVAVFWLFTDLAYKWVRIKECIGNKE
jgi:hypothetical protein